MEGLKGRTAAFPGDTVLTEPGPGRDGCRHSDAHTPRFPGAESRAGLLPSTAQKLHQRARIQL